jgi:hypothetical protein
MEQLQQSFADRRVDRELFRIVDKSFETSYKDSSSNIYNLSFA